MSVSVSFRACSLYLFDISHSSVPQGTSMCDSHNVGIPCWILICCLCTRERKASSWLMGLSGLNCLITVIIWTGSKVIWRSNITLVLLERKKKLSEKKANVGDVGLERTNEDAWHVIHKAAMYSHTYTRQPTCIYGIHLHVSEFPASPGHFGATTWKGSMSEPRYLQRKVQGLCDLFMTPKVLPIPGLSALHCNLCWLTDRLYAFSYAAACSSCLKSKQSVASVLIIYVQGERKVFMWGNEMGLTPAPLWT